MRHDTPTGLSLGLSEDHGTLRVMAWATRSRSPLARFVSVRLGVDVASMSCLDMPSARTPK